MAASQRDVGDRRFTAYCGLYCRDCIPSDEALFSSLKEFKKRLDGRRFDEYARLKAKTNPKFDGYPAFAEVLGEIGKLECARYCREGGCKQGCEVRACAVAKGYEGCWECGDQGHCGLLSYLKGVHTSLEHNLEMVRKHGIDGWSGWRGKHYVWSPEPAVKVRIRNAVADDAAAIARVKVDTWRAAYHGLIPDDFLAGLSYEENTLRFSSALYNKDEYFFVAEADGAVIGFVGCGPERPALESRRGEIYAIYVLPPYQGRGIGRLLMKAAAMRLNERGFDTVLLWVLDGNPNCRFYERLGGVRASTKKSEIGLQSYDFVSYVWNSPGQMS